MYMPTPIPLHIKSRNQKNSRIRRNFTTYFLLLSPLAATIPLSIAYTISLDTPDLTDTNDEANLIGSTNTVKKVSNSSPEDIITPRFKGSKIAFTGDVTTNTFAKYKSPAKVQKWMLAPKSNSLTLYSTVRDVN